MPSETFDCIIFKQTLQLIYDVESALETLCRILKPGRVLLATISGISQRSDKVWANYWYWNFTSASASKLINDYFPNHNIEVQCYGNILAAISFLQGITAEELTEKELDYYDLCYEILISIRTIKNPYNYVATMNYHIPILTYHQVSPSIHPGFAPWSISPGTFASHMKIIKLFRFETIDLDQLLNYKNGKGKLPKKPIVITFDDGLQEAIDYTAPILENHGFTAVYYIPTDYIGRKSHWLFSDLSVEFPIINWDTVKQLDARGFQIGSHTKSHPDLVSLPHKECLIELFESRTIIEEYIGHMVLHLAYPFGSHNGIVRSVAEEAGYKTASTTISNFYNLDQDLLLLPRIDIAGSDTLFDFFCKIYITQNTRSYIYGNMPKPIKRLIKKIFKLLTN